MDETKYQITIRCRCILDFKRENTNRFALKNNGFLYVMWNILFFSQLFTLIRNVIEIMKYLFSKPGRS